MAGLMSSFKDGAANSEVNIAAPKDKGRANSMDTKVTLIVPTKRGGREYLGTLLTGCQEYTAGAPDAGGGNVTIIGRKWLLVKPILYETPRPQALDPTLTTTFVTSLEVYSRTTNEAGNSTTTSQALLIYESNDCGACWGRWCCGGGPPATSDPATTGAVIARAGIRDGQLGLVTPGPAVYDASSGTWSSVWNCGGMCDPDRVTVRYLAGYPLLGGQMDPHWRAVVAKLAAAELKRRICACRESNERLHDLQQDMSLQSTQTERYQISQRDMDNPFGLRKQPNKRKPTHQNEDQQREISLEDHCGSRCGDARNNQNCAPTPNEAIARPRVLAR